MSTTTLYNEKKKALIPQLRFSEFDGEWEQKSIEDLCSMQAGKFISASEIKDNYSEDLFPCYGGNGLRGYTESFNYDGQYSLIGRQGALCGNITFAKNKFHATEHAIVVKVNQNIDNNWIYYILNILNLNQYATGQAQPGLSVQNIKKVGVTVTNSLPEQQKIASFLSAVDEKIQQLSRKKELLEQYKKGVMQQLFSGKLRFKDENGEDYPDWEEKKLGDFCTFFSGGTPTSTNQKFYSGTIPFIGSGNIYDSEVFSFISEEALNSSSAKIVDKGDLLYALYGANSGELAISKINGAINQAILCIRNQESIEYLYYVLILNKDNIVAKFLQGGQGNLSAQIIKRLKYKFPSIKEQQKIANFLSSIDTKIENVNGEIGKTQLFKKGLLQQMFV